MTHLFLHIGHSARRFSLFTLAAYLAVVLISAFGHNCGLTVGSRRDGAAGVSVAHLEAGHGEHAAVPHGLCFACVWETEGGDARTPVAPNPHIEQPELASSQPQPDPRYRVLPSRPQRGPPSYRA